MVLDICTLNFPRAPVALRAAKLNTKLIKPTNCFIMASSIAHGHIHTITTINQSLLILYQHHHNKVAQHSCGHASANRLTKACSLGLQHTSLILDIHVMVIWQLFKQGVYWLVSHHHITGSGLELFEVVFLMLSTAQVLIFRLDRRLNQVITLGQKEGINTKTTGKN